VGAGGSVLRGGDARRQAQSGAPAPKADSSLTWNGITLYSASWMWGVQYQTHGVPISDYFPAGTESIVQKNSNGSHQRGHPE